MTMMHDEQITNTGDALLLRAPAKINLSLLVAGRRSDGFHEIETVMAKINLFDEILLRHSKKPGIELICQGPNWAPQGAKNLVYKAARLLVEACRLQTNIKITLTKNIPAGTGLGSASSDAAATLLGLKEFLGLDVQPQRLKTMAASLGSDVPFFLGGPLAFCTGKGEKVKKFEEKFDFSAVLVLPDISISTKEVYENYKHDAGLYEKLSRQINSLLAENRIDLLSKMCANMLRKSCFQLHNELADLNVAIESFGLGPVSLNGSGSTMFRLFGGASDQRAVEYKRKLEEKVGCKSIIVTNNRW